MLRINDEQRTELERWASSRTLPAGDVFRARLILALASGKSYSQVEAELGTSRPTIARWRKRFQERGLAGLDPQHKGSQPRTATPQLQARIIRRTLRRPDDGSTHWCMSENDRRGKSALVNDDAYRRLFRNSHATRNAKRVRISEYKNEAIQKGMLHYGAV